MVTTTNVCDIVHNSDGSHAWCCSLDTPALLACLCIKAVDKSIGRACNECALAERWCTDDTRSGLEPPLFVAQHVVANDTSEVISGVDSVFRYNGRRIDTCMLLHNPTVFNLWEGVVDRIGRAWEPVGRIVIVLRREGNGCPAIARLAYGVGVNKDRVVVYIKLIVLTRTVALLPEVRDIGDAGYAVVGECEITMIMPVDKGYDGILPHSIGHFIPVVYVNRQ